MMQDKTLCQLVDQKAPSEPRILYVSFFTDVAKI